jgi:hypothetical protein
MMTRYAGMGDIGDPPVEVDWRDGAEGTEECPVCHRQGYLWRFGSDGCTIHGGTAVDLGYAGFPPFRGLGFRKQCDWPI